MTTAGLAVWSKSQSSSFKECSRKHALSRWSPEPPFDSDPRWAVVQRLKKISNRFLWSGSLVHETIGDLLKTIRQGEPLPSLDHILSSSRERMREEFRASRSSLDPKVRLFEHEYNVTLSKERWASAWAIVESCVKRFYSSPWKDRLMALPPESWKTVDDVLSFQVDEIKAYVKIDCAIESDGQFTLIDWKTSVLKPTDKESLTVAALYAHEVWGADPSAVTGYAVSLLDGRTIRQNFDEDALMEAHLKIQDEGAALSRSTDAKDPFSHPIPKNPSLCQWCNFKQVCHPIGGQLATAPI